MRLQRHVGRSGAFLVLLAFGCSGSDDGTETGPDVVAEADTEAAGETDVPADLSDTADTDSEAAEDAGEDGAAEDAGDADAAPFPAVFRCADDAPVCSPTPSADCTIADLAFVASEYGSSVVRADDGGGTRTVYRLAAFVERVGPSSIDVLVVDREGNPVAGVPVAFHWPDAPDPSRPDEWFPVKVTTPTGADGVAGFALGPGAYLPCCGCGGPHAVWVSEPGAVPDTTVPSDLAAALGMLGGTNHRHLDLLFQRVDPPPAPEPVDPVRCPLR